MKPLRCIALGSNVAFITDSAMLQLYPILVLHCLLLPVNVWRLWQIVRLRNGVAEAIERVRVENIRRLQVRDRRRRRVDIFHVIDRRVIRHRFRRVRLRA